jgi:hypothetical protein
MAARAFFDPDPRTALNNTALVDSSPASAFSNAYVTRVLRDITYNAGVYSLTGPGSDQGFRGAQHRAQHQRERAMDAIPWQQRIQ